MATDILRGTKRKPYSSSRVRKMRSERLLTKAKKDGVSNEVINDIRTPFTSDHLDNQNGHCDIYLYFTFKQLGLNQDFIELGGEGWATHDEPEEVMIRYRYGYHL